MAGIWITTAGKLADGLEKWIAANYNPTTPEGWEHCLKDLIKEGSVDFVGNLEVSDVGAFKQMMVQEAGAVDFHSQAKEKRNGKENSSN